MVPIASVETFYGFHISSHSDSVAHFAIKARHGRSFHDTEDMVVTYQFVYGDTVSALSNLLKPFVTDLENLLLDPNNPRFAELGQKLDAVPETRFAEPKVQQQTYERMKTPRFDVSELRDTIRNLGFLPMDRIVVRPWKGGEGNTSKYVVIEGNRRTAALKWLIELQDSGRETFTSDQVKNFTHLEVLLLDDEAAPENSRLILPGLRHVSGIKEWGPYQKARAVHALRESGMSSQEAAQSIGLSTRAANQLWRSYLALEQMREDEEYGEFAEPGLYSYFEEVFKRGNVRDWLGWSDEQRKFTAADRLKEFYGWMVGEPNEAGETGEKKLPEAKSVRILGEIIDDAGAMSVLRSASGTLTRARRASTPSIRRNGFQPCPAQKIYSPS